MDVPTDTLAEPAPPARREPRQRWRLTFARTAAATDGSGVGRPYASLWEAALSGSGLPVVVSETGRPRFALASPLPAGASGRAELADAWLTERLPAWRVREALEPLLPAEHQLTACEDIWLGAPALAGRVAAADYTVELRDPLDATLGRAAAERLLAASNIPRERTKGTSTRSYDLRPLLVGITVDGASVDRGRVGVRTRIHPELGTGRPDEVVAALGDVLGARLEPISIVRERILFAEDLDP